MPKAKWNSINGFTPLRRDDSLETRAQSLDSGSKPE